MARVPSKPRRRTYRTGQNLPAVTTEWRPIPLGRDENGDNDGQIRALAVLLRNRADSPVYIREGPEADDAFEISAGEDYRIWEPNGVNSVRLKGETGGETVEVRTLEAHNDFDITDRIEAFARSIAHFVGTATTTTTIEGQTVDLTIDSVGEISSITDSLTIGDITGQTTTLETNVANDVVIGDITGQTATLNTQVDSGNVVIDDVTATSASFDGDITGQTNFDLSAAIREGETNIYYVDGSYSSAYYDSGLATNVPEKYNYLIKNPADYDGRIEQIQVRVFDFSYPHEIEVIAGIDYGSTGTFSQVSPRGAISGEKAQKYGGPNTTVPHYYPNSEVTFTWEPDSPPRWKAGDSVGIEVQGTANSTNSFRIELEVHTTEIVKD